MKKILFLALGCLFLSMTSYSAPPEVDVNEEVTIVDSNYDYSFDAVAITVDSVEYTSPDFSPVVYVEVYTQYENTLFINPGNVHYEGRSKPNELVSILNRDTLCNEPLSPFVYTQGGYNLKISI